MRKTVALGTVMVLLATATNLLHAVSHIGQHVLALQAWQWAYVICVIFLAPIVAMVLLWTRYLLTGAWLLIASMLGSFLFDFAYHYLIPGPDNVFTLQPGAWLGMFWVSSVLLVAVSGLGTLVGGWTVVKISRTVTPPAAQPERPRHTGRAIRKNDEAVRRGRRNPDKLHAVPRLGESSAWRISDDGRPRKVDVPGKDGA